MMPPMWMSGPVVLMMSANQARGTSPTLRSARQAAANRKCTREELDKQRFDIEDFGQVHAVEKANHLPAITPLNHYHNHHTSGRPDAAAAGAMNVTSSDAMHA